MYTTPVVIFALTVVALVSWLSPDLLSIVRSLAPTPDPARSAVLKEAMDNYGIGTPEAEWPNNMLSRFTVAYENGAIARRSDPAPLSSSSAELALCKQLSAEAKTVMGNTPVGMGSESSDSFDAFFISKRPDQPAVSTIDEMLIRTLFAGTIFPPSTIVVEPMQESGSWWQAVVHDCEDGDEKCLAPWHSIVTWFKSQAGLRSPAWVQIGDQRALSKLPHEVLPRGTVIVPGVLPRLAVALTEDGSLVGLFGVSVQT